MHLLVKIVLYLSKCTEKQRLKPIYILDHLSVPVRMRNVVDKSCRENENIRFVFSNFSYKMGQFMRMWKNILEPGRRQVAVALAHCTLDTSGYKHAHTTSNTYCCPTARIVARKRLTATWYVHCLACLMTYEDAHLYVQVVQQIHSSLRGLSDAEDVKTTLLPNVGYFTSWHGVTFQKTLVFFR